MRFRKSFHILLLLQYMMTSGGVVVEHPPRYGGDIGRRPIMDKRGISPEAGRDRSVRTSLRRVTGQW